MDVNPALIVETLLVDNLGGTPMPEKEFNEVSYPAHYVSHPSGIECIDVIEHMPANIAMAMK